MTEPEYLRGFSQHLRATGVRLQGPTVKRAGRDPLGVVRAAQKAVDQDSSYDAVWCVFDVDTHVRLGEAVSEAEKFGFQCAISNPSFEIWLLWHYEDCRSSLTKAELRARMKRVGVTGKAIPRAFPYGEFEAAIARAGEPMAKPDNPGSTMSELARSLSNAGGRGRSR